MLGGGHRGPLNEKVWTQALCALCGSGAPGDSSKLTGKVGYAGDKGASASRKYNTVNLITLKKNLQIHIGVNLTEISIEVSFSNTNLQWLYARVYIS